MGAKFHYDISDISSGSSIEIAIEKLNKQEEALQQQNNSDKPQTELQTKETTNNDDVVPQQQQQQQQSPENETSETTTTTTAKSDDDTVNAKPSLKIKRKNTRAIKEQDKMEKELLNQQVFEDFKKFLELEFASESK